MNNNRTLKVGIVLVMLMMCIGLSGCGQQKDQKESEPKQETKPLVVDRDDKDDQETDASQTKDDAKAAEKAAAEKAAAEKAAAQKAAAQKAAEEKAAAEKAAAQEAETKKKGILIAIDPGHQSFDVDMSAKEPNGPGSSVMKAKSSTGTQGSFTGIPEYQLNLDVSLLLRDALVKEGYDVLMTREDNNKAVSNAQRATMANDAGAKCSIRIHANGADSSAAKGALVLIPSADNQYVGSLSGESRRLGEAVLNSYCSATGFANRGITTNDTMTGINWSKIPVVILEMGFMTNESDDRNMADPQMRTKMVAGIVSGVNQYFGN